MKGQQQGESSEKERKKKEKKERKVKLVYRYLTLICQKYIILLCVHTQIEKLMCCYTLQRKDVSFRGCKQHID